MQGDKRLGLGLGILLVGVVGALFFRLGPPVNRSAPELNDAGRLDERIAQRAVTPYPDPVDHQNPRNPETTSAARGPADDAWALPDFLQDGGGPAPNPIPAPAPVSTPPPTRSSPEHNRAWRAADQTGAATVPETSTGQPPAAADANVVLHRVIQGDTLSDLAARYLGSSRRFLEIYEANRGVLRSPNDLRVGLLLRIPTRREAPPPPADSAPTVRVSASQSRPEGTALPSDTMPVTPAVTERQVPEGPAATASKMTGTPDGSSHTDWRLRFQPIRRSPLLPRGPRMGTGTNPANGAERAATRQSPVDLLPLEHVFEGAGGTP